MFENEVGVMTMRGLGEGVLKESNDDGACNEKMEGDFPVLQPGVNAISWDGDVTRVVVSPNWRTL